MLSIQARALAAALNAAPGDECIPWIGRIDREGYGRYSGTLAHRAVYEKVVGPIPDGFSLDHLCHVPDHCGGGERCPHRRCVNPRHLTPSDWASNTLRGCGPTAINARKTACNEGHDFTPENTYITTCGGRRCRRCGNAAARAYRERKRAS